MQYFSILCDTLHLPAFNPAAFMIRHTRVLCSKQDLLLVANKGGYAFAVDPDDGSRVWTTDVGGHVVTHHCFILNHLPSSVQAIFCCC